MINQPFRIGGFGGADGEGLDEGVKEGFRLEAKSALALQRLATHS